MKLFPAWPRSRSFLLVLALACVAAPFAQAQAPLVIYSDNLANGFQDWSWATDNLANTATVHSGTHSISVSGATYTAVSFYHPDMSTALYTNLSFWINGGSGGGQVLTVQGLLGGNNASSSYQLPALAANTWKQFSIPLSTLGIANKTNFDRFWLQYSGSGTTNTFYLDDVQLGANPAPALVHLGVNATQPIRVVDARLFGINTAVWDTSLDTPTTVSLLNEAGLKTLRFPGGSLSDEYHWAVNKSGTNTWSWGTSITNFAHLATNIGAQAFITVNYGSGTPAEAAGWVANYNVTNHYGFKYWEIGNEEYGTWETDSNSLPHDPYTYATRAMAYIQQMKAVDHTIKIGVMATPGETNYVNYSNHPAYNPRTGQTNYGWTPVLLATLKTLGVTPDFIVHHRYPEYTGSESDALLLQDSVGWAADAADLRQQITDYFGASGTNIELVCTENNSNSGAQGKQSVSLVNGLYYADSLGQLMKTEFNSFVWWDLRNGVDNTGDLDPSLYGWRMYGDIGSLNGDGAALTNRYPEFFTAKLMQYFTRGGDTVLSATSDYGLLAAYGARRTNGAVTLLVINKDSVASFTAQIALSGFSPAASAVVYSYGIPQDNAAETGTGSADIALTNLNGAASVFNYTFAPYSATVLVLPPAPPKLAAFAGTQPGQIVVQVQGQAGARYVLQNSANLSAWTPVTTNTLLTTTLNVTNTLAVNAAAGFWRAVWQP